MVHLCGIFMFNRYIVGLDVFYRAIYRYILYKFLEDGTLYSTNIFIRSLSFCLEAFEAEWEVHRLLGPVIYPIFDPTKLLF